MNAISSLRPRRDLLEEAAAADVAVSRGERVGRLHGVPQAIKDTADTKGLRMAMLLSVRAGYDDRVPQSLDSPSGRRRPTGVQPAAFPDPTISAQVTSDP